MYKEYINKACNAIAMGGLSLETKEADSVMEKSRAKLASFFSSDITKSNSDLFTFILLLPFRRVKEYASFLSDIRNDTDFCYYSPFSLEKIKIAHNCWKELFNEANQGKVKRNEFSNFFFVYVF